MTEVNDSNNLFWVPSKIKGVTDDEMAIIAKAAKVFTNKQHRNYIRSKYFEGKVPVKDLGLSLSGPIGAKLKPVVDWPAKACTALARRSVFEGFVTPDGQSDPFEINSIMDENNFDLELPQVILSAYKHSCAFFTLTRGDRASGEPEIMLSGRSALWSGGLWDYTKRQLAAVLCAKHTNELNQPDAFDVYLPGVVLICTRQAGGSWVADRRPTGIPQVSAEVIAYDPQLDRPFGRSRISRAVMSSTDNAIRTIARMEIAAEHYAIPRIVVLGMVEEAFQAGKWKLAWDQVANISRDEDNNLPEVKQLTQLSMAPLIDMLRQYASQLSAATGIPLSSLGIVVDNPPSAEAMFAAERDLIDEAREANKYHSLALKRLATKLLAIRDGSIPDGASGITATWANPAFTSFAATADATTKLATVFSWMQNSEVALEMAGFSRSQVSRLMADKRKSEGLEILRSIEGTGDAPE